LKSQDLLGIFLAIGITVVGVGIAFAGESFTENNTSTQTVIPTRGSISQQGMDSTISRGPVTSQGAVGGITNTDGESISFEFNPSNEINLDESNGFIRAKITYTGYLQQMGPVTLGVYSVNTGEFVKKSEIQLDLINENIWVSDVMHRFDKQNFIDNPDLICSYLLRVDTEHGTLSGKSPFTVLMPSVKQISTSSSPSVVAVTNSPQQKTTVEIVGDNVVEINTKVNSFSLSDLEPLLKDKVRKTYLAKILKEYYAETISKEEFLHLKSFDDLDCSVNFADTPNGEEINISCNLKSK